MNDSENDELEALLEQLRLSRSFDFTAYKRTTLGRRIQRRLQAINMDSYTDYMDYLEVHPDEFSELFNTILINVSSFFRDRPAWDWLKEEALPEVLSRKRRGEQIRVWSAGCAAGQEAYSLAMLFAEQLGIEQFRDRVKVYATDIDQESLSAARHSSYTARDVREVPEALLEKYFERTGPLFSFRKDLRRSVIFGEHDLLVDAPISRIDLLACRNTLMYFNQESQSKVLARFHFALNEGGYLFLGKAEMQFSYASIFNPVHLKHRVFTKISRHSMRERLLLAAQGATDGAALHAGQLQVVEAAFETDPMAQIIVDGSGRLAMANLTARDVLGVTAQDTGRPLQDLELSYRPVELRSLMERAYETRSPVFLEDLNWSQDGQEKWLNIQVIPLLAGTGAPIGARVAFSDVTLIKRLQRELEASRRDLETAYEELQSTNEELETTNEELQSTVEELETTNEELQSTNEELETMNEELQSTNEELETVNEEMGRRSTDLLRLNLYLTSILGSLEDGVIVMDLDYRVQMWNERAADQWGLREEEVRGKEFFALDIGLPVHELRPYVKQAASDPAYHAELEVSGHDRRGKSVICKVTCMPLAAETGEVQGTILLVKDRQP